MENKLVAIERVKAKAELWKISEKRIGNLFM
jgi:hypothetical protein